MDKFTEIDSINDYVEMTDQTAIYPGSGKGTLGSIAYAGLGLAGETGEVADIIKKIIRDDNGHISDDVREQLFKEIGDVAWYWARLCKEFGFDPAAVLSANMDKLLSRKERGVLKGSGNNR